MKKIILFTIAVMLLFISCKDEKQEFDDNYYAEVVFTEYADQTALSLNSSKYSFDVKSNTKWQIEVKDSEFFFIDVEEGEGDVSNALTTFDNDEEERRSSEFSIVCAESGKILKTVNITQYGKADNSSNVSTKLPTSVEVEHYCYLYNAVTGESLDYNKIFESSQKDPISFYEQNEKIESQYAGILDASNQVVDKIFRIKIAHNLGGVLKMDVELTKADNSVERWLYRNMSSPFNAEKEFNSDEYISAKIYVMAYVQLPWEKWRTIVDDNIEITPATELDYNFYGTHMNPHFRRSINSVE